MPSVILPGVGALIGPCRHRHAAVPCFAGLRTPAGKLRYRRPAHRIIDSPVALRSAVSIRHSRLPAKLAAGLSLAVIATVLDGRNLSIAHIFADHL
ncbi:MAG TPA: hypothetical protein VLT57_04590, partial [Bryobacteraceae bacterium]|nr:hypothetical protein [Bryobacteraceae bacterium]